MALTKGPPGRASKEGTPLSMKRRKFLTSALATAAGMGVCDSRTLSGSLESSVTKARPLNYLYEDNRVIFWLRGLKDPVRIIHITDTHLWKDDSRGEPFSEYSKRMAGAYHVTKHFRTGADTNPEKAFIETLDYVVESKADLVALTGDIFSFPSECAIEWALSELEKRDVPFLYTAGNHDWHYEGMKGSSKELRQTWTGQRLRRLYRGNDPLMASYDLKGIKVLVIDNSIYNLLPEQLAFLEKQEQEKVPYLLMMHIPMYVPGKGYGLGDPGWGAAKDNGYQLERRERWPEGGHLKSTFDFYEKLIRSEHLLGMFVGHAHQRCLDVIQGIPQFVTAANATGAFTEISVLPLE
jgi:hypothetical protein